MNVTILWMAFAFWVVIFAALAAVLVTYETRISNLERRLAETRERTELLMQLKENRPGYAQQPFPR